MLGSSSIGTLRTLNGLYNKKIIIYEIFYNFITIFNI